MKKIIAAASLVFLAAAANAHNSAPENTSISPGTSARDGIINNIAPPTGAGEKTTSVVSVPTHRGIFLKLTRSEKVSTLVIQKEGNTPPPESFAQNVPKNNPQKGNQEAKAPEVKSIPKARRVEKPSKVESSARRDVIGSAKRPTEGSAKQSAVGGKPNRAGRPEGAGRPANAGKPGNNRGKN
ncbi:MAG: hypothetical protein JWQ14_1890 [Adhaeribacter sp.]|nr:hypothetical protein [Adhaeribacter sp.]